MPVPVQPTFSASIANGVTTVFPYGFKITAAEDLQVSTDGTVITTGFTVSGVGDDIGGNVTFTVAPVNGTKVLRALNPILKRETDYQQFGDWKAEVVDNDFDRIWLALQTLQQNDIRALKLPFDTTTDQVLTQDATGRANKGIKFDGAGNLTISTFDPDEAGTAAATATAQAGIATTQAGIATTQAGNAAASAAAAQAAVNSVLWRDVVFKGFADSPITITNTDAGKLFAIDTSGGNVVVNLPQIAGLTLSSPWTIGFKKTTGDGNTITINRAGTDLIDGATSSVINAEFGRVLVPDTDPTPDSWTTMQFGSSPYQTASQAEMEAGTEAALRAMSPLHVAQAITAQTPGYRLSNIVRYDSSGSGTYNVPSGVRALIITAVGGGGGGGAAGASFWGVAGAAGGMGVSYITSPSSSYAYSIGAGGAGGSAGAGGNGGSTTIAGITASGGTGGLYNTSPGAVSGGAATGGNQLNLRGDSANGSSGASSPLYGARASYGWPLNTAGQVGVFGGGGGAGSGTTGAGGNGGAGFIEIKEYK